MPVPASINDLSTTASSNSPAGSESPGIIDDIQRAHASFIATLRDQSAAQQTALNAKLDKAGGTLTGPLNEAKGADIASATTVDLDAVTGNMVIVTGAETITAITLASGAERTVVFGGTPTIQHNASLILPTGLNIVAALGDVAKFRGDGSLVRCVSYSRYSGNPLTTDPWLSKAIGEPFFLRDDLTGVPTPPTNSADYRYIKLTASDAYNTGVLTSESVSGSAPLVVATATISLAGSPLNGQVVNLLNTERRFLRAGSSGALQDDALQGHSHQVPVNGSGASGAQATGTNSGAISTTNIVSDGVNGTPRIANETRSRNQGATVYMRIK